jgi:hypothetical protein
MPVSGELYTFNQTNVDNAPTEHGVYSLHYGGYTIYIGKADGVGGIRGRLQSHLRGNEGPCTKKASTYKREGHADPATRERELLSGYKQTNGKLPECNDVMPK